MIHVFASYEAGLTKVFSVALVSVISSQGTPEDHVRNLTLNSETFQEVVWKKLEK